MNKLFPMLFSRNNETFKKLGAISLNFNMLIYLKIIFSTKYISAATLTNVFHGTTNFSTLVEAILLASYFGCYKTLDYGTIDLFLE